MLMGIEGPKFKVCIATLSQVQFRPNYRATSDRYSKSPSTGVRRRSIPKMSVLLTSSTLTFKVYSDPNVSNPF